MSNETKIGLLAIVAIAISIWGYRFVMGSNILVSSNIFYIEYEDVDQLKMSSPVLINGFQVGVVSDIYLKPDNYEIIVVELDLDKGIFVPRDAVAQIISTGFMGGKAIKLLFDKPCKGADCAESGDYLQGDVLGLLSSMVAEDELKQYVDIVTKGLKAIVDTLNNGMLGDGDSPLAKSLNDIQETIANLKNGTGRLNSLLASSSSGINGTIKNLETLTADDSKLQSILSNADQITGQLNEVDFKKTLDEVNTTVKQLNETIVSANAALGGVSTTVGKINDGEGTIGMLMQDKELYYKISTLSTRADSLITDLQQKPYRYVPFKGRKKVKRYDKKDAGN